MYSEIIFEEDYQEMGYKEMNEMNAKLAKIKKSAHVGKIVTNVLCIIAIVGCVMSLISGIYIYSLGPKFDQMLDEATEAGYVDTTDTNEIGSAKTINIQLIDPEKFDSDIPAIQEKLENNPASFVYGIYMMGISVVLAGAAIMIKVVSSTFGLIEKDENPFTDRIIKRVTTVLIVVSALLLLTNGAGLGIVSGVVTWLVYTVMDYGRTLQIQSDETL